MPLFFIFICFWSFLLQAIDLNNPAVACGGKPCRIRNVKTCPAYVEYNTDQDIYRNYIIDGIIYAKDHRYYAKGGVQDTNTFFPTKPGDYVILYSNKIHDMGLVIDMQSINNDSANIDKIQFHSFADDGPQLPYATDDDHLLLTTAKMSSKHTNFLSFNLYTKYVNGVVPRITGLPKLSNHPDENNREGIEFCLRGFGLMKYNHNHGKEDHSDLSGVTQHPLNSPNEWHWKSLSAVAGVEEGERDYYEFGTMDLQFTGDIYVKDVKNINNYDEIPLDGLYLINMTVNTHHNYPTEYQKKFHRPINYRGKWAAYGLYYQMPKDHADEYKGNYPLLSMHPASVAKKNLMVRNESTGEIIACYHYGKQNFITSITTEAECK